MYAVIETGGKQYKVQPGDFIQVEKLDGEIGAPVLFDKILLYTQSTDQSAQIWLGKPYLSSAKVEAEIVAQGRGEKIVINKFKRRKDYMRTQGHRQFYTQLLITQIDNGGGEKAALSTDEKSKKLNRFKTLLKPKGPSRTPKTLGSRKRMAQAKAAKTQK